MTITSVNGTQIKLDELTSTTLKHIKSKKLFHSASSTTKEIEALKPEHLKIFVRQVIDSLTKERNALAFIEQFAKLIGSANLGQAAQLDFPEFKGVRKIAARMQTQAKEYLELTTHRPPSSSLSIKAYRAAEFLLSLFEGFLESFGLINLFNPNEDSQTKTKKIIALFALISTASAILIPVLGLTHGFLGIAFVALLLVGTGQIYPLIRPMPVYIPETENWTKKYWEGRLRISPQNFDETSNLAFQLDPMQPVILRGPSGAGKTELAKTFVRDVSQGKYPNLKGKRCFYVNTALLSAEKLLIISRNMRRHRNNIIVIFDNLQDADQKLRKQLELMLKDKDRSHFPYFIGITTEPNFFKDGKSVSLKGTPILHTDNIIRYSALQIPSVLIDPEALHKIGRKSIDAFGEDAIQPKTALSLLHSCVNRTSNSQKSSTQERVDELKTQIRFSSANRIVGNGASLLPYGTKEERKEEETELRKLVIRLETEKKERASFFTLRDQLGKLKTAVHKGALKISDKSSKQEKDSFLLLSHYFLPTFEEAIKKEAKRLQLETEINEDLIDRVLGEEAPPLAHRKCYSGCLNTDNNWSQLQNLR